MDEVATWMRLSWGHIVREKQTGNISIVGLLKLRGVCWYRAGML
jgi:hypothetical protein